MGLYKRDDSPIWWMSFSVNGRPYRRSTGTDNKKLAEAILGKVKTQVQEGRWFEIDEAKQHTFDEMMDRLMRDHAPTVSKQMQKSYRNCLAHLGEFFSGQTLDRIDTDSVMQYVAHRREQTCVPGTQRCDKCKCAPGTEPCRLLQEKRKSRPATRNRELAMLSKAFNLARLWKWTKENPCELVKREKEHNDNTGKCLPVDREDLLFNACEHRCNGQLLEMVKIAIHTGLREAEILNMRWEKIEFKERTISVIQKGGREKIVPMNETVFNLLKEKARVRSISGYVFTTANDTPFIARNMYREFQKACKQAGIEAFRFHDLRHTTGTRLAQAGHDIYAIACLLGHSQLSTAKRYAKHNTESMHNVVKTLDKKRAEQA